MGSWSVYCGTSRISITAGKECVLLPLKKSTGESYIPYQPATLPIFGEYDDYGGLENIKEDENTKLIEEHFGISILEFTKIFTDWFTYKRDEMEDVIAKMKNFDEMEKWKFMFIDKKVYDFMSTNVFEKGHLEFGNPELLTLLGFEYIDKNENGPAHDPKRFCQEWKIQDKLFYSDGEWLHFNKNDSIYYFNSIDSKGHSLAHQINIPEDKMWIGEKSMSQLWSYLNFNKQKELLSSIIGKRYGSSLWDDMDFSDLPPELIEKYNKRREPKNIADKYIANINTFGDGLAGLVTYRENLHCMSGYFEPFILYLTPQCGEFSQHQRLLEKFAEINKEYIDDEYIDEDEDNYNEDED